MEALLNGILKTILYGGLGIVLMIASICIFDIAVPYDFKRELKEKNVATGFMMAGMFIAVAIIVRTVIM